MGGICPGVYIFIWCVVRNLQYFPLLFSQTFSLLYYLRSRCIFYVLSCIGVPLSSPLTPIISDPFAWPLTMLGVSYQGTLRSQLIVHIYSEVTITLIWWRACLDLKCCFLLFVFALPFWVFSLSCFLLQYDLSMIFLNPLIKMGFKRY